MDTFGGRVHRGQSVLGGQLFAIGDVLVLGVDHLVHGRPAAHLAIDPQACAAGETLLLRFIEIKEA